MSETYVYFLKPIGMNGPIKIGCSQTPVTRLEGLAAWSPFPLELLATAPGDYALEQNLHQCFADVHYHREWFHASAKLSAGIAAIASGKPLAEAFDLNARIGSIKKNRPQQTRTPQSRQNQGWQIRLCSALKRAARARSEHQLWWPEGINEIVWLAKRQDRLLTAQELATLTDAVANVVSVAQTAPERWPRKLAA